MRCDLPSSWLEGTLGEHVELLAGFPFQSERFSDDQRDTRLLRGDNVAQGRLRWDGARRWPKAQRAEFARYELELGDVVLAMDRPWIQAGLKFAVVRKEDLPSLLVQRVARLRARETLNQRFLAYLIADRKFTGYVQAVQTGTAVPHISGSQIAGFPIRLPSLNEQARVADVLGALDDKIDSNRRLAQLLEESAATLFRGRLLSYLSVDEHEEADAIRSPQGWVWGKVKDIALLRYGKALRAADRRGGGVAVVGSNGVVGAHDTPLVEGPVVIVGRKGTAGSIIWVGRDAWPIDTTFFAEPVNGIHPVVIYFLLADANLPHLVADSAVPGLNRDAAEQQPLRVPPRYRLDEFSAVAGPLFDHKDRLREEVGTLAAIRDALLPKLVSGEIRVPDTADPEEVVGPAAEEIAA